MNTEPFPAFVFDLVNMNLASLVKTTRTFASLLYDNVRTFGNFNFSNTKSVNTEPFDLVNMNLS